eukprot:7068675-Prorocentrum_lima.AAC.1
MTSSLVGSEMCIRDRHKYLCLEQEEAPEEHDVDLFCMVAPVHVSSVPVSYTHLTLPTICSV